MINTSTIHSFEIENDCACSGETFSQQDCACSDKCITQQDCTCVTTAISSRSATLTAWLHLTNRCNLHCDYCYIPHSNSEMSHETGQAAIDAAIRSALIHRFIRLKLKYSGGEPLLRFALVEKLHSYAYQKANEAGLELEGVILTNGTLLTAKMVERLKSLDLRLMISLDGIGVYNDAHRRYQGGRSSYTDVTEAIDLAVASGLAPTISVTVSSRNAEGLAEVIAWILERDLPFSLNFYRTNDFSVDQADLRLDDQVIIQGMLSAFKVIENNLPRRKFLSGIIDRANLSVEHNHTCGVGQNYLMFDPNGQIAKCQMQIGNPVANINYQDPLAILRADQDGIQNISVDGKNGCRTCEWKYWCAGGCPLETFRLTGRYDLQSPNCNIYKALFPEALRLEQLRQLKYPVNYTPVSLPSTV